MDETPTEDDEQPEPTRESAVRRFMRLLEEKMLEGRQRDVLLTWAMELGVPEQTFAEAYRGIKLSWTTKGDTYADICERRDEARARYMLIYRKAMKQSNLATALKAVEKMVELDGLEQPIQINHTLGGAQGSITNLAREQVASLVEKMRMLAAKQAGVIDRQLTESLDTLQDKVRAINDGHVNGKPNGSNGHDPRNAAVIDVGDKDDEDLS